MEEIEVVWGTPLPPIIFGGRNVLQQTIYHWKGNLMASRISTKHFNFETSWAIFAK